MRDQILSMLNGPTRNLREQLLHRAFEKVLSDRPELFTAVALMNGDETKPAQMTFGELNTKANALARTMLKLVKKRSPEQNDSDIVVALRFLPSLELVVTIMALAKAGLAYVPIAPNWPEGRIRHILDDSQPIFILTNAKADILYKAVKLSQNKLDIFQVDDVLHECSATKQSTANLSHNETWQSSRSAPTADSHDSKDHTIIGRQLLAVLYTSGSTGTPKGVRLLHQAATNRLAWQFERFPYRSDDVCMFKTTLTFVDSVSEIFGPLNSGLKVVIFPKKVTQNVEVFVEKLEEFGVTRLFAVTSLIRSILCYLQMGCDAGRRLSKIYQWECSAETVTLDLLHQFFATFPGDADKTICDFYGSTEMMDVTYETFSSLDDVKDKVRDGQVPIGVPIHNSSVFVLDTEMRSVEDGQIGQLYVASFNLADGYMGNEVGGFMKNQLAVDRSAWNGVLYSSGDFARIVDGRLFYEGRSDSQVKIRGHRVDLAEISRAVNEVEEVDTAVVLCYKAGDAAQKVLCYYTAQTGKCFHEKKLENKLKSDLPEYMMPIILKLPSMPLLVNGKIDRQSLINKYEDSKKSDFIFREKELEGYVPTSHFATARILLISVAKSLFCTHANKPKLSDNFFDIGGDSINMVQVMTRLNDHGLFITLTEFALANNLADVVIQLSDQSRPDTIKAVLGRLKENCEYTSEKMKPEHEMIVIDMISRSFAEKGDLTTLASVTYTHLYEQVKMLWDALLKAGLSLVVLDACGVVIGSCLNFDAWSAEAQPLCARAAAARNGVATDAEAASLGRNIYTISQTTSANMAAEHKTCAGGSANGDSGIGTPENETMPEDIGGDKAEDDPSSESAPPMSVVEFLHEIEEPLKELHCPQGKGKIIYTSLLGTASNLTPAQNVKVALFLELENIRYGKERGFEGIFTTNANRLTQHISKVLDYQILSSIQINQYEDATGSRPFAEAPDDLVTEVALKFF